jgi:hypothetical protein
MDPGDPKDPDGRSLLDPGRGLLIVWVLCSGAIQEPGELLSKVPLLPGRPDPGTPQQPPEIPGHDQGRDQARRADDAKDPAGAGRSSRSGRFAEDVVP